MSYLNLSTLMITDSSLLLWSSRRKQNIMTDVKHYYAIYYTSVWICVQLLFKCKLNFWDLIFPNNKNLKLEAVFLWVIVWRTGSTLAILALIKPANVMLAIPPDAPRTVTCSKWGQQEVKDRNGVVNFQNRNPI